MLNPRAPSVEISIHGNEYTIHQSPSLLSSHRAGGTTGAGKYGLRYGVHTARMIYTSSFMICPRNPQRPQTQARTSPQVFYPSPKCPDQARGSRRRIRESFYPLFVCASALGGWMSHLIRTLTLSHCAFLAFFPQTRDQIVTCSAIPWLFPYLYLGIPWRLPDYPQNHHPLSCSLQSITIHPEISSLLTLQKKKLSPMENHPPIRRMDNQSLKPALDNFPP